MKEEITTALTSLIETFTQTKDFVLAQAPDVIQQLIAYTTIKYTIWVWVIGVIDLIAIIGFIRMGFWEWKKDKELECTLWVTFIVGAILTAMTSAILMNLIKINIAPKVWLIEYAAQLTT